MGVIDKAVQWAIDIANDSSHGYDQGSRWGPDYDCSSFVISAYEYAGAGTRSGGATYTGDMKRVFTKCGFTDVTKSINLNTGSGTKKGDVLLNEAHHTALVIADGGKIVHASINEKNTTKGGKPGDQTGSEICVRSYYNKPWDCVLRYSGTDAGGTATETTSAAEETNVVKEITVEWNNRTAVNVQDNLQNIKTVTPQKGEIRIYVNNTDITDYAGNIAWKNTIYELATTASFEIAKTTAKYVSNIIYVPVEGDIIRIFADEEIYRGVVTKVDDGDENRNRYDVKDLGWYFGKTEQTYQFKNVSVSDAIKQLSKDLGVEIDELPEITTAVNAIYFDKTASGIITDLLDSVQEDYSYYFTPKGLKIFKVGELITEPIFVVANNIKSGLSIKYMNGMSHSVSIEDMVTSVKVTSDKDNVYKELLVKQDADLMSKYGFLQKLVKIDPDKEDATAVAEKTMYEYGRKTYIYSFEIIEQYNSYTRAGQCIMLGGDKYVVEASDHSIKNGWHHTKLTIKKWEKKLYFKTAVATAVSATSSVTAAETTVSKDTQIMGTAIATAQQMISYLKSINPSAPDYAQIYLDEGSAEGVRGDIAFAQSCVETGFWKFGGDVKVSQNNFAGIGETGGGAAGNSFSTPTEGIRAQIQHLKAYASTDPLNQACVDPRFNYVDRGCAPTISGLDGKWAASGGGYSTSIINILNDILKQPGGITVTTTNNSSGAGSNGKVIVLDPGHGKSSWVMNKDEKVNAGYEFYNGTWGEWRHFKNGTWGSECGSGGCVKDHSCWYSMGNGDRSIEPTVNLNNALAAKKYLEQMGYTVRMTRTSNDENPSFTQRAANAFLNKATNKAPDAKCIVCIHSNAGGGRGSAYISLNGGSYKQKYIPSDYISKSNTLGEKINSRIVAQTSLSKAGSGAIGGESYLILFHKSPVPVGYMEIGFFDNASDKAILDAESDKIGKAIAEGVNDWLMG
ncbi:MAG: N-acetylmuramoyl-L-alanine amidase [Clostridia bacterium]|nr:N-acetylmuramoyl-L-alanine amidase [Clostridia bacterium]